MYASGGGLSLELEEAESPAGRLRIVLDKLREYEATAVTAPVTAPDATAMAPSTGSPAPSSTYQSRCLTLFVVSRIEVMRGK